MESLTKQFEERIAEFLRRTQLTPSEFRERGRSVEVVAVTRTPQELERARTRLDNWVEASGPS